jgi:hypothetical protein
MHEQLSSGWLENFWRRLYPGEIPDRLLVAERLKDNDLELEGQSNRVCDCSVVSKVSTRMASRSPETSVDECATHLSSSLPGGKSRTRPGPFIVSTFQ